MEELCSTDEPPHKHRRGCHHNLSPPPQLFFILSASTRLPCHWELALEPLPSLGSFTLKLEGGVRPLLPPRPYETRPAVSLCPPSSLCRCRSAPAADGHQARLFQLTLGCINNGLLYALSSTDVFVLQAEGKRGLQFLSFIDADRSVRSPNPAKSCWTPLNFQLSQTCSF